MQNILVTADAWFLLFFIDFFLMGFVGVYAFYTYYKHRVDLKKIQLDSMDKADKIMQEAAKHSQQVMEKVEHKADEILNHSQLFKTDMDKNFRESLANLETNYMKMAEENSNKFTAEYERILTAAKDASIQKSQQAVMNIETEIKKQLETSHSLLHQEIEVAMKKAQEEINQYKIKELAKIDEKIDSVVSDLAKELLRINLTPKDHKKLVMQALEKAKNDGLFFL